MSKVSEFLQANPVQYLATVGRDGKAVFENNMAVKDAHGIIADFSGNPPYEF